MPDLWDTNPRNAFSTPDEQPDLAPDDDHTKEMMLKDHRGHLYSVEMAARTSSRAARGWQRPRPGNLVGFDRHRRVCAQAEHARSDAASTTRDQLCRHHRPSTAPRHPVLRCFMVPLERRATVHRVLCNPKPQVSMGM
jgi:hypothetical protein